VPLERKNENWNKGGWEIKQGKRNDVVTVAHLMNISQTNEK